MRFRKASLWIKLGILGLLVILSVTMVGLQKQINEIKAKNAVLSEQIITQKQENEKLAAEDEDLQSYVKQRDQELEAAGEDADEMQIIGSIDSDAMEELTREQGYVEPDEIVFEDVNN